VSDQTAATTSAEARQRWRLVVARDPDPSDASQRDVADAWTRALASAGLPLAWTDGARARARISFGAPLPVGIAAERELIDVVLTERWPTWRLRDALDGRLPPGWRVVDLHDVWLAGPPLAGRVAAADYRVTLADAVDAERISAASRDVLAANRLPRSRQKGAGAVEYDLRPLLVDLRVRDAGPPVVISMRTLFHPELGTGRPEEVVAALGERLGIGLVAGSIVRERVLLTDELAGGLD
jgi:radical SAM-linked protein